MGPRGYLWDPSNLGPKGDGIKIEDRGGPGTPKFERKKSLRIAPRLSSSLPSKKEVPMYKFIKKIWNSMFSKIVENIC